MIQDDERDVFISYHTASAAETVHRIVQALESMNITCWYSPRDFGQEYADSIVNAIRHSRIFLFLLNEHSNISQEVLNEIKCAFDRLKNNEDIQLLPFRLDNCVMSNTIYYFLNRYHTMDGSQPPEEMRIQELQDRITFLLNHKPTKSASVPSNSNSALSLSVTGSIVYPDNHFIGREKELSEIEEDLSGVENVLFLTGMGGIGKSEVAKMYAKRHARDYDVVCWVSFDKTLEHTIASDSAFPIQGLSRSCYPQDSERSYYKRKLRALKEIADERVLIIIDNFDVDDDTDLDDFCGGRYAVLFTTRCRQIRPNIPEVEILPLTDKKELLALFRAEYTRSLDQRNLTAVENLISYFDGHTLSVRLIAAIMQNRRINPKKMLAMLKAGQETLKKENVRAADMLYEKMQQVFALSSLTEQEMFLLKNLSLISLRGIAVETLFEWCGLEDFDLIDNLINRSWVIQDPVRDYVHLHPLICQLLQEEVRKDPGCCEALINALYHELGITGKTLSERLELKDYAYEIYNRLPTDHPQRIKLLKNRASAAMSMTLYNECIPLFLQIWEEADDPVVRLYACSLASQSMTLSGHYKEAYAQAKEGWKIVEEKPEGSLTFQDGYHLDHLINRIIESNCAIGDYDTAAEWGYKALALFTRYKDTMSPRGIGWVRYHLACTLCTRNASGDQEEAERLLLSAIEQFEECQDNWSKSYALDCMGQVRMKQGRFQEALDLSMTVWDMQIPLFGEEHADIANTLVFRANIYKAMGRKEEADSCYMHAIAIYDKLGIQNKKEETLVAMNG